MQILSLRGNKAYDCFRFGLKQINAPDHVMRLLPDFTNEEKMREAEALRLVILFSPEVSKFHVLFMKVGDQHQIKKI